MAQLCQFPELFVKHISDEPDQGTYLTFLLNGKRYNVILHVIYMSSYTNIQQRQKQIEREGLELSEILTRKKKKKKRIMVMFMSNFAIRVGEGGLSPLPLASPVPPPMLIMIIYKTHECYLSSSLPENLQQFVAPTDTSKINSDFKQDVCSFASQAYYCRVEFWGRMFIWETRLQ